MPEADAKFYLEQMKLPDLVFRTHLNSDLLDQLARDQMKEDLELLASEMKDCPPDFLAATSENIGELFT